MDISGPQQDLLMKLMSASSLRAKAIAGNVANQNTPGYKRQDVRFEDALLEQMKNTNPDLASVQIQMFEDAESPARADGNNVQIEDEVGAMRENLVRYQLYANILEGNTRLIESAINGDR
jgi:flagellar basal-body rod protein FlgB